jgi:hypothetical protein
MRTYLLIFLLVASPAFPQHEGHEYGDDHEEEALASAKPVLVQTGSGTSWMPGTTPPYMWMHNLSEKQHLMVHGNVALRYLIFNSPRAENTFSAPNWVMASLDNKLTPGDVLSIRLMLSVDRLTEGGDGYPLLFQTGETWQGERLVDKQHPHDLFGELAVMYRHDFNKDWSIKLYAGLPGEPALGPTAFMHRPSAMSNPDAPLGHHWQDATHISFGVLTAALSWRNIRIEGSAFNGSEPDEDRYGFDRPQLGSYSGRLSYNPTDEIALQVSGAKLKNPERNGHDQTRITASGMYTTKMHDDGWWATTLVWGRNDEEHEGESESWLLESQYTTGPSKIYGRFEVPQKFGSALKIPGNESVKFTVTSATVGYAHRLVQFASLDVDLGGQVSYLLLTDTLKKYYGDSPYTAQIILTLHPSLMHMMHLHR